MPLADEDLTIQIKTSVITAIQRLPLVSDDGLSNIGNNVLDQMIEDDTNQIFPSVIVTQHNQQDVNFASTFETEHWWIPMLVIIADRQAARDSTKVSLYARWRSMIRDWFQHQPLEGLDFVHQCIVIPKAITDSDLKKFQYVQQALLLRFIISVTRTINA